jgi:hypothetical protein
VSFCPEALYLLLQNPIYHREVRHKDQSYPGQHEAIIPHDLWAKVQDQLRSENGGRKTRFKQQRFLRLIRNLPVELLPPVDSIETLWQDWERATVESKLRAAIVGSENTVKLGLQNVAATGADEVIAVTEMYEHADRLRSYEFPAGVAATVKTRTGVGVEV